MRVEEQHAKYFPVQPDVRRRLMKEIECESYRLLRCTACGLTFASPMRSPGSAWYEITYRALDVRPEKRWEYQAVLSHLTAADSVYEIGCGTGAFLRSCADRRVAASGIDFWPDAVQACRDAGLDAMLAHVSLTRDARAPSLASVVVAFQVLEHLDQPDELFRHATDVSQSGARLWISVPSNVRVARVLQLRDPMDDPPHHMTKWTRAALAAIGRRNGWRLENLSFEPFSMRNGLWSVASHFAVYEGLRARGWLQSSLLEKPIRAVLYPGAWLTLVRHRDRGRMTGTSMLARYTRSI